MSPSNRATFQTFSYTFGKQVSFDVIAVNLYRIYSKWMEVVNKYLVSVSAAFCASLVACIFSQPGDMILTETYKGHKPGSFAKVLGTLYARGGPSEFFRGTGARIVHVGMIITSQLVIYDIVKQLMGLPATGAH
jgi:solute carrier family 25 (mitochondrial phosphate transporter), member 3